jgi:ribonuclease HII
VAEIEEINILQASRQAMARAVAALGEVPEVVLVDAVTIPMALPQVGLVKGDQRSASIAAASILAKVTRDRLMAEYAVRYPGYGFDRHKGYPTRDHRDAVARLGPSPIHRKTFRGVREFVVAAE